MSVARLAVRHCAICGSVRDVEANHVGGRNHIAWFTVPLCRMHHERFHILLRQAGIDLTYTPDTLERTNRVLKATKIFEWMVLEEQQEEIERRKRQASLI